MVIMKGARLGIVDYVPLYKLSATPYGNEF